MILSPESSLKKRNMTVRIFIATVFMASTAFGQEVGSRIAPNRHGLLPVRDDPGTIALSELYVTQAPSERLMLVGGKINGAAHADENAFASMHRNRFITPGPRIKCILLCVTPCTCTAGGDEPRHADGGFAFCFLKVFETSRTARENS